MGLRSICTEGYAVSVCRCMKEHFPLQVVPCKPGHLHKNFPMDVMGTPLTESTAPKGKGGVICPRCEERVPHLHGGVCGFCADQLEELGRA